MRWVIFLVVERPEPVGPLPFLLLKGVTLYLRLSGRSKARLARRDGKGPGFATSELAPQSVRARSLGGRLTSIGLQYS